MKATIKTLATGVIASVLIFTACKKGETGPAGTNGTNGANGVVTTSTDGYIKGNLSGTRQDATAFNEAFNFQNYWGGTSGTLDSMSATNYLFSISRGVDILSSTGASIDIKTTSKTATTGTITLNNFSFNKSIGTNKMFSFNAYSSPTVIATGLSYNATTGLFSGNFSYSLTGLQNSSGNTAIISGSFQATMTQTYMKKETTSITIKD